MRPGLRRGEVVRTAPDPDGEFRVLVALHGAADEPVWARAAQFSASNGSGACFFPDVGDDVVVGFLDDDPGEAILLGSLYGSSRAPALAPDEANARKAIVARSGLRIDFDEQANMVAIATPGGRIVRLDDDKGEVTITDPQGNFIALANGCLTVSAVGDLALAASRDLTIHCGGTLSAKAAGSLSLAAPTIAAAATEDLSLASGGMGSLTGEATLQVRAALVTIN